MPVTPGNGTAEQLVLAPRLLSSERDLNPRPILGPKARQVAAKGIRESDGVTESDRLLHAIITLARKEPQTITTKSALRFLIFRCSRQIALGF